MRRRDFILTGSDSIASIGGAASLQAQQARPLPQIGYMSTVALDTTEAQSAIGAWQQGLREQGYTDRENIVVVFRSADGKLDQLPAVATELVDLNVDMIVAPNSLAALAAQRVTTTIPIVVQVMGDPIGDGLVASLARPGGNVTGSTFLGPELVPKRIDLIRALIPAILHLAVLWHPGAYGELTMQGMLASARAAARSLGIELHFADVKDSADFDRVFSAIDAVLHDALIVFPSPMWFNERRRVVALAANHRLPAIFGSRDFVELGGLMSYGTNLSDYKILKGTKPADLPVEQPTQFELVINLKTAKALGLTVPQSLLARADEVIE